MNQNEYMIEADQQPQPYSIRLPVPIRRQLEEAARLGGRSLHAEIIQRLSQSLEVVSCNTDENPNNLDEHIKRLANEAIKEAFTKAGIKLAE